MILMIFIWSSLFVISSRLSLLGVSGGGSLLGSGVFSFLPEFLNVGLVLLSDDERRDVDDLSSVALVDGDFLLEDEGSSLMDGFGVVGVEDDGLESSVQELLSGQPEDVIELLLLLAEDADSEHSVDQGFSFENSLGVLLVEGEEVSRGFSDSG